MMREKIRLEDLLKRLQFKGYVEIEAAGCRTSSEMTHGYFTIDFLYKDVIAPTEEEMNDTAFYYMLTNAFLRPIPSQHHSFGMVLGNEMRKRSFWEKSYGEWKFPFRLRDKFFCFDKEEKIS